MTKLHCLASKWRGEADYPGCRENSPDLAIGLYNCADELAAALAESGWRPISTAPRDGTTIIMWHGCSGIRDRVVVGAYDALAEYPWRFLDSPFRLTGVEHDGDGMCNAFLTPPTHWMPLPPPPEDAP